MLLLIPLGFSITSTNTDGNHVTIRLRLSIWNPITEPYSVPLCKFKDADLCALWYSRLPMPNINQTIATPLSQAKCEPFTLNKAFSKMQIVGTDVSTLLKPTYLHILLKH